MRDGQRPGCRADNETLDKESSQLELANEKLEKEIHERERTRRALEESEQLYRMLADNVTDVIWTADLELNTTYVSPSVERLRGYTREEVMGQSLKDMLTPASFELAMETYQEELALASSGPAGSTKTVTVELEMKKKDGSTVCTESRMTWLRDRDNNLIGAMGVSRDITERRRAEQELLREKNFSDAVIDSLPGMFYMFDIRGLRVRWNHNAEIIGGYSAQELERMGPLEFIEQGDRERVAKAIESVFVEGDAQVEAINVTKSGQRLPCLFTGKRIDIEGEPYVVVVVVDISEPKKAEERSRIQRDLGVELASATGLDETLETCLTAAMRVSGMDSGGIYLVDDATGNLDMAYQTGLSAEFVKSASHYEVGSESARLIMKGDPTYSRHRELGVTINETRGRENLKAIAVVPVSSEGRVIGCLNVASHSKDEIPPQSRDSLESISSLIGIGIGRARIEHALRERNLIYKLVVDAAEVGVWDRDVTTGRVERNERAAEIYGYSLSEMEANADWWESRIHPDDRPKVMEVRDRHFGEETDAFEIEYRLKHKSGEWIWVMSRGKVVERDEDGRPLRVIGIILDVTEQKRMEEELLNSQKLESIGLLAGGIAHDFNNILTGIYGSVQLARMSCEPGSKIDEILTDAERASRRAADLTKQLLTFAKGGAPVKMAASVSEIIAESSRFALRGSNVKCEFNIPQDLDPVAVDIGQMNQMINNIIINAVQAMPEGGIIKVRAENIIISEDKTSSLPVGHYVRIGIEDQGHGIAPDEISKIFDPYYTSKETGSGLGLATSYSIVKQHGGLIEAESELNRGTTFIIYLPASLEGAREADYADGEIETGRGRILLVDDDESVRQVTVMILEQLGYEAVAVSDGSDGIELYLRAMHGDHPFDAVIMDLTIPGGMGGKQAIAELKKIDPEVKAIVASGYSNDPVMANHRDYGFAGFVAKPFAIEELAKALREVIKQ